jgi:hypothetical protein
MDAHNKGLDYIDIVGTIDVVQDFIGIAFNDSYFCKNSRRENEIFIEQEEGYDVPVKHTEEELENLVGYGC